MNDKTISIVRAAHARFARYGYGKTTMNDIAAEAGVARQTVYNTFQNKEDVLRAVVRQFGEESLTAIQAAWADDPDLPTKLETFARMGPLTWFEAVRAAPDWAELLEGMHSAASEELSVMDASWNGVLREMFTAELQTVPDNLDDLIDFFYSGSLNAKYGVDDIDVLRRRLATIRTATLALLQEHLKAA